VDPLGTVISTLGLSLNLGQLRRRGIGFGPVHLVALISRSGTV